MRRSAHVGELADACLRCHTITDDELIEAGHRDGLEFDVAAAIEANVRHNFHIDPSRNAAVPSLWHVRSGVAPQRYRAARRILGATRELAVAVRTTANGAAGGASVRVAWARAAERRRRLQRAVVAVTGPNASADSLTLRAAEQSEPSAFFAAMSEWERSMERALLPSAGMAERPTRTEFVAPGGVAEPDAAVARVSEVFAELVWAGHFDALGAFAGNDRGDAAAAVRAPDAAGSGGAPATRTWSGVQACAECHEPEYAAWRRSAHARSWAAVGTPRGQRYVAALNGSTASCRRCHAPVMHEAGAPDGGRGAAAAAAKTPAEAGFGGGGRRQPARLEPLSRAAPVVASGVGCEACHGAAGRAATGWIDVHADLSLSRRERAERAARRGMVRPADLVALADRCVACHIVDDSRLIEAGHPAGGGWEFVGWSAGEVRHNLRVDPHVNDTVPSLMREYGELHPADRRRRKFLIGVLVSLMRCTALLESTGPASDASRQTTWPSPARAAWHARRLLWLAVFREVLQRVGDANVPEPLRLALTECEAAGQQPAEPTVVRDVAGPTPQGLAEALRWLQRQQHLPWARSLDPIIDRLPVRGEPYAEPRR